MVLDISNVLSCIMFFVFFCCAKACKFFFKLIFIGVQLLYNVVLVSTVQQNASAMHIHISPLFWISFPLRSPQSIKQGSLCSTVGSDLILCIKQRTNQKLLSLIRSHLFIFSFISFALGDLVTISFYCCNDILKGQQSLFFVLCLIF